MRIAFTGSGGTGKTTTLKELNKTLKYPVIHEGVRQYLKDHNLKHLRELSPMDTLKMQNWLLDQKEISEKQSDFIADRTSVDNLVYAMYWLGREDDMQNLLMHYMKRCMKHAVNSYDLIVVFPHGAIPLEDDGVRSAKPMYQWTIQMLIERLLGQLEGPAIYGLQSLTLRDRCDEIQQVIKMVEDDLLKRRITNETEQTIIH